ncbi:peptide deformylase [Leptolyngbya sp. 'hensonii']|uniref:peptide deformylase n=1 Tax=Leptolyngbya sp. 'hensonii' TaxID=1922337 RepID=UPI0009503353|nr:peptide deformylase [Leptolyngbya sp. 'hensonii']OLP19645.1 peptide deformylase [Leptolyngbya sp. 'hensonii']
MSPILNIAQLGDPILRQPAQPIEDIHDLTIQTLIDNLLITLTQKHGVGLAAPQVSQPYQLLIVASHPNARYPQAPEMEPTALLNPHLVAHSDEVVSGWEGCLSVPGLRGLVPRYRAIEVEYTDRQGHFHRQQFTEFIARIFQHEYDHLEGLVFLDRIENNRHLMTDQEYLKQIV